MLRTVGLFLRGGQPARSAALRCSPPSVRCCSASVNGGSAHTMTVKAKVGQPAPPWRGKAVLNDQIKEISLDDYKGQYLVLLFYPADWSFVCPSEIISFNEALPKFKEHNTSIVGASVDSVYSHEAWVTIPQKQGGIGAINFPLLSDITKHISRDYGILIEEGPDAGHALRGLFIIDPEGRLRQKTVNDLQVGRSVDETLRLVQAFQFAEKHGDDCPVNWHPGMKGVKGRK